MQVERFAAMGTRIELTLFGPGGTAALPAARQAIAAVDDALTVHRPSAATALNAALADGREAAIDDALLFDALVAIDEARDATGGLFDPTVGASGGRWAAIAIDRRTWRVRADGPAALDFGGFGKGFALDRAVDVLREAGVRHAFLSAGESSIAVVGDHPAGGAWSLAVPRPGGADGAPLVTLALHDAALSVSSTIGADAPGRRATLHPADGAAVSDPATAVAVDRSGAMAEMLSTALLVADAAAAERLAAGPPMVRRKYLLQRTIGSAHHAPELIHD